MSHFIPLLIAERDYQKSLLQQLKEELSILSAGSLCYKNTGKRKGLYHQTVNSELGKARFTQHYVSKENLTLCMELKRRRFIEKSIPILSNNTTRLTRCIDGYLPYDPMTICSNLPAIYSNFPLQCFSRNSGSSNGIILPVKHLQASFRPEGLKHMTAGGIPVRSKSEALIAGQFEQYGIEFEYEPTIELSGRIFHPDFSGHKPRDHSKFYWEHWGMTGNDDYLEHSLNKLGVYIRHGIIPGQNLIISCDNLDGFIDVNGIKNMIAAFLL